eukprot:Nitzschia sp. Nitz4//scaffold38_size140716//116270//116746//NITZ4_003167-RA/size140716-processed-gene-0.78-mRNA-1//-1//CDS//3329550138//9081//frame0
MDLNQSSLGEEQTDSGAPRGVRFAAEEDIEQVQRISRYSNYEIEEIIAYWGDGDEHQLRKEELREAVQDWKMGRRISDNFNFTSAGIADKVGERKVMKRENRMRSRGAVLDEQELQQDEGMMDSELLADIYKLTTASSKKKAREEAARMAAEVEKFTD